MGIEFIIIIIGAIIAISILAVGAGISAHS